MNQQHITLPFEGKRQATIPAYPIGQVYVHRVTWCYVPGGVVQDMDYTISYRGRRMGRFLSVVDAALAARQIEPLLAGRTLQECKPLAEQIRAIIARHGGRQL